MLQPTPSTAASSSSPLTSPLYFFPSSSKAQDPSLPQSKLRRCPNDFHPIRAQSSSSPILSLSSSAGDVYTACASASDAALLSLLRQRKTDDAYQLYVRCSHLPGPTCLSRLVAQLAYQGSPAALSRAQSLITRLRDARQLHRLDANSLGLLAVAAVKSGATDYALSLVRSMLRSGYLPHVKAWTAVVSRLSSSDDGGPASALRLFDAVLRHLHRLKGSPLAADARPDTAAFNAALNAAANLGDVVRFTQLFDEMPAFKTEPDVLTYNILIKLCARIERKDLLVFVLERIIRSGLDPCITTLQSLVAALVGLGDLPTAEKLVQAMREGRRDLCLLLRDSQSDNKTNEAEEKEEQEVGLIIHKLAAAAAAAAACGDDPPLLPKAYPPDARIYTTLMKGYMKTGRASDVVRMVAAMRREPNPACQPDIVTYTTAITALANAGAMDRARAVLDEMSAAGVPANRVTYNVLLKGYCAQLQIDKAEDLIRSMAAGAGIEPDVFSYNILIDGCILVDDSAGALAFFNEMRKRGIPPSKVSYTTLMKAFVLSGQPRLAHQVFEEMEKDPRVKADRVAFNMLVEGHCRLGLIEEAKRVVEKMKEKGFLPDVATYGSLASGIVLARKPGEALLLWKQVKERCEADAGDGRGFRPDEGLLEALAEVCVRAAFFRKALEIVACMEEYGIAPNKTKYKRIYVEMHSRMFTSKHASPARQARRSERKRAAEAFKFWLGLPNSYYGSEWRLEPADSVAES
ncbi:Pentatricopeptide repeat-containing protein [Apostasia shenzhenica]|uniref:Pentatricopeptide repeat-containing protein n=1 Tax=Apostasia shenzhenica TaxID=1088818 RepID=A0A2I0B6A0_9ASPA|nr:Pentatricopeptide repeat-containing protein [Apostasia shenzhenica]